MKKVQSLLPLATHLKGCVCSEITSVRKPASCVKTEGWPLKIADTFEDSGYENS